MLVETAPNCTNIPSHSSIQKIMVYHSWPLAWEVHAWNTVHRTQTPLKSQSRNPRLKGIVAESHLLKVQNIFPTTPPLNLIQGSGGNGYQTLRALMSSTGLVATRLLCTSWVLQPVHASCGSRWYVICDTVVMNWDILGDKRLPRRQTVEYKHFGQNAKELLFLLSSG